MHELGIALEIINLVEKGATQKKITLVDEIGLKIGALSGIDPEALRFAIEASTIDTPLAGVKVTIEHIPVRGACRVCRKAIEIEEFVFICPHCGSVDLDINQGEELDIVYISGH
ncbi:MAG: hydrogenase maturation nickel metallochaperone HypA [Candidatus Zixiibacteriota bacterium]